jgi:hypothetical protein
MGNDSRNDTSGGGGYATSVGKNHRQTDQMITKQMVIAVFVLVPIVAPVTWMLFDRIPPYEFTAVEITPKYVFQGGEIYITFTVRQLRPVCSPGLAYREFKEEKSGKMHTFDPVIRAEPPVVINNQFTRIARLPESMTPGPIEYRGLACYTCNPIHSWLRWPVCSATPNGQFIIVERPPA